MFTMTCGEGHNMIAKALSDQFEERGIQTKTVQLLGHNEKSMNRENKMFLWTCKHIPHIYDFIWRKLCKSNRKTISNIFKQAIPYMAENIEAFKPDIIICTHLYASNNLTYMKKHNMIDKKIIIGTIMHDYCLCPYWQLSTGVDYIFQPYTNTTQALINKGFHAEQIKTFGLPIRIDRKNKNLLSNPDNNLQKLKSSNKFKVLIIAGGNGLGNTLKLLESILNKNLDVEIIIINGKNKKNYNKIQQYIEKQGVLNVVNLGFVDNILDYMSCADTIITRCGASTISEIFTKGKPFIAREKMILNEKITKKMFMDNGCALGLNKVTDAGDRVEKLMNNPELYKSMAENVKEFSRPNAASDIVEFLIKECEKRK